MKKRTYKKTIQKSGILEICMVFCIMLILPINISLFVSDSADTEKKEKKVLDSEIEWQVLHELAAVIPVEYEEETLKAQAVILRTNILADGEQLQEFPLLFTYKEKWGNQYNENCEKLLRVVTETEGMYLVNEGAYVRTSYFRLSNGSTRNAAECLGKKYTAFTAKKCGNDLLSEEFVWKKEVGKQQFFTKLVSMTGEQMTVDAWEKTEITYARDSAGYVLSVSFGSIRIGGEIFRQAFFLPSSDFTISCENDTIFITTRGIGNGIGFCQYGANEMAKEGKNFLELLNYFFTNIAISKTE